DEWNFPWHAIRLRFACSGDLHGCRDQAGPLLPEDCGERHRAYARRYRRSRAAERLDRTCADGNVAVSAVRGFLNFMGKMGLAARADPPKAIDMTGREWGEPVDGLVLSVRQVKKEDPDQLAAVSVVLKNESAARKAFTVPGLLFFYKLQVISPGGSKSLA